MNGKDQEGLEWAISKWKLRSESEYDNFKGE